MMLFLQLVAVCLVLAGHQVFGEYLYGDAMPSDHAEWSYHGTNGPEYWCQQYPGCCKTQKHQSPVNINIDATKFPAAQLIYENYDVMPDSMELFNNEHTVVLTSKGASTPSVSFKLRGSEKLHTLDHIHFHWGKVSSRGSEHTLDENISPMEMHIVHRLSSYKTLFKAAEQSNESIAVIGVFFKISKYNNSLLNDLINGLKLVKYGDCTRSITPFKYTNLFPQRHDYYFTYKGSLTTPPCSENVMWFVMNAKVPISEAQLNEFRQLQEKPLAVNPNNAFPLVDNFRPLQDLHRRTIRRSKQR